MKSSIVLAAVILTGIPFLAGFVIGDSGVRRGLFNACVASHINSGNCADYVNELKRG
jgi:hypothetical protein